MGRHRHPRITGRFHHHRQLVAFPDLPDQRHQLVMSVTEPALRPHHLTPFVAQGGHMRRPDPKIHTQRSYRHRNPSRIVHSSRSRKGRRPQRTSQPSDLTGLRPKPVPNTSTGPSRSAPSRPVRSDRQITGVEPKARSAAESQTNQTGPNPTHPTAPSTAPHRTPHIVRWAGSQFALCDRGRGIPHTALLLLTRAVQTSACRPVMGIQRQNSIRVAPYSASLNP